MLPSRLQLWGRERRGGPCGASANALRGAAAERRPAERVHALLDRLHGAHAAYATTHRRRRAAQRDGQLQTTTSPTEEAGEQRSTQPWWPCCAC